MEDTMAPTPVLWPGESHGRRSLVGCSPWGCEESDTTERLHFHFSLYALEKEMATHSSVLAWRIPGTGEPGGLLSMGSHRVRHDWSDLAVATMYKWQDRWLLGALLLKSSSFEAALLGAKSLRLGLRDGGWNPDWDFILAWPRGILPWRLCVFIHKMGGINSSFTECVRMI